MNLKGTKTEQNLMEAFAGESQARNKYTFYASKAKKDGYVQIANIFEQTVVPDAFGPLNKMLFRQTFMPNSPYFDPSEEIGGAIMEYLKNQAVVNSAAIFPQNL